MNEAVFVVGPESSGTKMLAESFVRLGYFGDYGHLQRLDSMRFNGLPERIVLRRSLPHASNWPDLKPVVGKLREASYSVRPVLIWRDKDYCRLSQYNNQQLAAETSTGNIEEALLRVYSDLASINLWPTTVYLEAFVKHSHVRAAFFALFGQSTPDMEYFDPDHKYRAMQ
jgi:hypothetical protein